MADGYSWNYVRGDDVNRLPGPEHLGWWAAVAMLLSVVLHVLVFFALGKMELVLNFREAEELRTGNVDVRRVEVQPFEEAGRLEPDEVVVPPDDTANLLEEIDLLAALPKDQELDIKPDVDEASFALKMSRPAAEGVKPEIEVAAPQELGIEADLPEVGADPQPLTPAAVGQVTIDPRLRAGDDELNKFTEEILKRGAGGSVPDGALDGVASLDSLLDLPPNLLISKKTMLPSDLLFEFNSAELRESAKVGLMKLALLMDRNPGLYCWIEGHTDLIGGESFNLALSRKRAEAVRAYLVQSLRLDGERIIARGFGKSSPIVTAGDAAAQAPNRRVEIKMRQTPPQDAGATGRASRPLNAPPPTAPVVRETPAVAQPVPRAVLVKPGRPVEEVIPEAPRAMPVLPPTPPRATEVVEPPPRAVEIVE